MKHTTIALALALCAAPALAYDPLADLVSTAKKEIKAKDAIESSRQRIESNPVHKKMGAGFWQFFQGLPNAKPGEACSAVFWKGDKMIAITGPGGGYGSALLKFIAVNPTEGFPRPENPKEVRRVRVGLTQGAGPMATVTVFNRTVVASTETFADELAFAVPTMDALLGGMEDRARFRIDFEGKSVFELEWHSGLAARDVLRRCVQGARVDGLEVPDAKR